MAYQQRDNSGSVFRNDRKREGKKDADFAGSAMIGGVEYWVDMWTKPPEGQKKGFFSISFREKEQRGERQQSTTQRPGPTTQRPPAHRPPPPPTANDGPDYGDKDADDIPF